MEDKGIIIENGALIDELTKIRECWVFKKAKENKNGLKIEKHIEMMNVKQSEMWKVVRYRHIYINGHYSGSNLRQ